MVVGSPIAGRNRRETEGLIGFFVNLLALRAGLGGDPTWAELLGRTRDATLGAYDHQELPFERLVEELATERSLTYTPVFQVVFALNRAAGEDERLRLGDLAVESFGGGGGVVKFDLDLTVTDAGERLAGVLTYRSALFDAGTIARMAGNLETVLEAMVADPGRRLSELSLLSGAERTRVLEAWNASAPVLPRACIHGLFAERAARAPGATAVVCESVPLTYADLERRSRRLSHYLRRRGIGPETRVALCAERSADLVVAILGILRAGGVYVPVDPAYPADRMAYLLEDSGCAAVLVQEKRRSLLPPVRRARVLPGGCARRGVRRRRRPPRWRCTRRTRPTSSTPRARPGGPRAWWSRTPASRGSSRQREALVRLRRAGRLDAVPLLRLRLLGLGDLGRARSTADAWWWSPGRRAAIRKPSAVSSRTSGSRSSTRRPPPSAS